MSANALFRCTPIFGHAKGQITFGSEQAFHIYYCVFPTMNNEMASGERRIEDAIVALARERLTGKQKQMLKFVSGLQETVTVTRLVGMLRENIGCSSSSIWLNLWILRKCGLLDFGSSEKKNIAVRLSETGSIVAAGLSKEARNG